MLLSKESVLEHLKSIKDDLNSQYHIISLGLFGSYAKDSYTDNSDIDIFYELDKDSKLTLDKYITLEERLQTIFNKPVELVNIKKMNPIIKLNASKDFIYV